MPKKREQDAAWSINAFATNCYICTYM